VATSPRYSHTPLQTPPIEDQRFSSVRVCRSGCNSAHGADAISTTPTTKKGPMSVATTRKMITRTRWLFAAEVSESGTHSHVGLLEDRKRNWLVRARADSLPSRARRPRLTLPKIAMGHAAVETSCAIPKASK
jgi:hypothetical protein